MRSRISGGPARVFLCFMTISALACSEAREVREIGEGPSEEARSAPRPPAISSGEILASATEGGWQNVDLLVDGADPLVSVQQCVQSRTGAASCYAFLSREAYEAAEPRAAGNFELTCWAARWTRNKAGSTSGGLNEFMPTGCPRSAKPERPEPAGPALAEVSSTEPFDLELDLKATVTSANRVVLEGVTNLPDGTTLSTSVSGGGFMGQDEAIVRGGHWRSGPFGPPAGLRAGTFEASVTLPYGRVQPKAIQARLGQRLEKLTGPLMKTDPDLDFMGQSANVKSTITIR